MTNATIDTGSVRDRILAAALTLFVNKGYHLTSIPEIVAASGTSIGAVYHHFASKEELAHLLHRQLVDRFVEMSDIEVLALRGARDRVRGYVSMLFRLTEECPEFVSYLIYTRPKSAVEGNLTVCSREGMEVTQQMVVDGKLAGEVRDLDDRVLCGMISGTIMRLVDLRLDRVISDPLTGLVDDTAEAIWAGIKL
jgi:AcrR family transcriptional regulator